MPNIAAGVAFIAPDRSILLLLRSEGEENYPGHWALPGGKADEGEEAEAAARRELAEEIGEFPEGEFKLVDEVLTPNGMTFFTFVQAVGAHFAPKLNAEHQGYAWFNLDKLPSPIHPSVAKTIKSKLAQDADFDESKHPRAENGEFGRGSGSGKTAKASYGELLEQVKKETPSGDFAVRTKEIPLPSGAKLLIQQSDGVNGESGFLETSIIPKGKTHPTKSLKERDILALLEKEGFGENPRRDENGEPVITTPQDQKVPKTLVHYTDGDEPVLSTNEERLVPNSLSLSDTSNASNTWGKNRFELSLKPDAKVLHLDLSANGDFWNFADEEATPKERGKEIAKYAQEKGFDAVRMKGVFGVGTETVVLNKDAIASTKRIGSKQANDASLAFDRASVRTIDADGHLHVAITNISKANVCPYLGKEINAVMDGTPGWKPLIDDKIYYLLRDPEELAKAAPTFNNKQLLSQHIPVNSLDHHPEAVIGSTGTDAEFVYPYLRNSLVVWTKEGIDAIESEVQKELSSAYRYRADMTPGDYKGEPYDGVMRDIVGNHVALVKEGRAGNDVVVGDTMENVMKSKLTRKGLMAQGALVCFLQPKLAQDAKIDVSPLLVGVTHENFKTKKAGIVDGIKKLATGKLAQDMSLDDLAKVVDTLETAEPAEVDPNAAIKLDDGNDDAGLLGKVKEYLKASGKMTDEEIAAMEAAVSVAEVKPVDPIKKPDDESKAPAFDEDKDDEKDKDMVTKPAMDAAIAKATKDTEARVIAQQRALRDAENAVLPYIGKLAMAHDSAEDVYRTALTTLGVEVEGVHPSAFPALLKAQTIPGSKRSAEPVIAMDEAAAADFDKRFPGAARIGQI